MTMPRWRTQTWAFLILNVVMVGLVFGATNSQSPMGGFVAALFGMGLVVIWLIGLLVVAMEAVLACVPGEPARTERGHGPPDDSGSVHRRRAPVAHIGSDMVSPRASADFLSRRAKREETQDDAPDADD
jgi:hypothetical protein